jgi:Zn-dependent protease with chaperone function
MFSQLFFVLLALILINFIPERGLIFWVEEPQKAFLWGLLSYSILLALLYGQSRFFAHINKKGLQFIKWPLVNVELLLFLGFYHFGLGAHRFFSQGLFASYQFPFILISLFLYFFALGWAHLWHSYFQMHHSLKKSLKIAYQQLLFYTPFCIPFLIISFLLDGWEHLPAWQNETFPLSHDVILFLLSLFVLGLTVVFLPPLMVMCWRCRPLNRADLKERLEKRCRSLHFRQAGLKIWSVMSHSFTAGIIGIVPAFRYILFTPALLQEFQPEEVEAILIHEIGHNRYRHLLCYPFIMLGMLLLGTFLLIGLEGLFSFIMPSISLENGYFTLIMGIFLVYALAMGFYFRFIFGFFSRLFERQADLYIFETSLSPHFLIQALDHLGIVTGNTHSQPNWHHFSIQERIHFLHQAMRNPLLIQQHHKRVKRWLTLYFLTLLISGLSLYWII